MRLCKNCPSLPVIRKCCFCVPIRKGVTIFGYVNVVLSLLSLPLLVYLLVEEVTKGNALQHTEGIDPLIHLSLTVVFVLIDVAMTIVLLVGAHKRNRLLLKVYLYFGIGFQLFTLCMDLVYIDFSQYLENTVYFIFLGLNIYLLLLVYNTIRIIDETDEVQYVVYKNFPHAQQWTNPKTNTSI